MEEPLKENPIFWMIVLIGMILIPLTMSIYKEPKKSMRNMNGHVVIMIEDNAYIHHPKCGLCDSLIKTERLR